MTPVLARRRDQQEHDHREHDDEEEPGKGQWRHRSEHLAPVIVSTMRAPWYSILR